MSEPITRELREFIDDFPTNGNFGEEWGKAYVRSLRSVADRIDEAYENAYREQVDSAENAAWESVMNADDEELERHGLVRLPVDADGEIIRPEDVVALPDGTSSMVFQLLYLCDGWVVRAGNIHHSDLYLPKKLHHHKATPAKRIRMCVEWIEGCYKSHGTLDAAVLDELREIADELEGDGE